MTKQGAKECKYSGDAEWIGSIVKARLDLFSSSSFKSLFLFSLVFLLHFATTQSVLALGFGLAQNNRRQRIMICVSAHMWSPKKTKNLSLSWKQTVENSKQKERKIISREPPGQGGELVPQDVRLFAAFLILS
jgi:hypothetical protein